jgi:hypothetical protein
LIAVLVWLRASERKIPNEKAVKNEKARRRFPGAGSMITMQDACDNGHKRMICPTCQIFFEAPVTSRSCVGKQLS